MKITSDIYAKQMKTALPELIYQRPKTSEKKALEDTFSRKVEEVEGIGELELYLKEKQSELEALNQKEMMDSEMQASKSQIEGATKMMDILLKCLKIASRIIDGDRVPPQDEKMLLENYPEMYASAKILGQRKEDAEEHDSLVDEEAEPGEPVEPADYSDAKVEIKESIEQIEASIAEVTG